MTKASRALLLEFHRIIENDVSDMLSAVTNIHLTERKGLLKLTNGEIEILRGINLSLEQQETLRLALVELSRGIVFGILAIVDGVAFPESEDIPDLALVDRETGNDIGDQFLHDEFYEVID